MESAHQRSAGRCGIRDVSIAWRCEGCATTGAGKCAVRDLSASGALIGAPRAPEHVPGAPGMRRPVPRHQMIARARIESDGYSRASRSMGVSNGRYALHEGACLSRGVGVRCLVIPWRACARIPDGLRVPGAAL